MSETTTLDDLVGSYGPDWRPGILSDHVGRALEAGGKVHVAATGRTYIAPEHGGVAIPVLCSEIVWIATEDGRVDGRCGCYVDDNEVACEGHLVDIRRWAAERDAEREVAFR